MPRPGRRSSRRAGARVSAGDAAERGGRLEIGGCDAVELAREFGTPAYVYAEDDMRERARATMEAFAARTERFEVVYASKAFPCTAALRIFAEEGLSCDVASGGELHLALGAGFAPERIYMHGNNKTEAELEYALASGVGHIVVDSLDEIDRLERVAAGRAQPVLLRVTPGIEPETHRKIRTGQVDSKFGIPLAHVEQARSRAWRPRAWQLRGLHAHIGSQVNDLERVRGAGRRAPRDRRLPPAQPGRRLRDRLHARGPASARGGVRRGDAAPRPRGRDRALRARPLAGGQRGRDALHGGHGEGDPRRPHLRRGGRRHVRQPAADALRGALRGRPRRAGWATRTACRLVGMHCESGDVLVPRPPWRTRGPATCW